MIVKTYADWVSNEYGIFKIQNLCQSLIEHMIFSQYGTKEMPLILNTSFQILADKCEEQKNCEEFFFYVIESTINYSLINLPFTWRRFYIDSEHSKRCETVSIFFSMQYKSMLSLKNASYCLKKFPGICHVLKKYRYFKFIISLMHDTTIISSLVSCVKGNLSGSTYYILA